jgi:tetraacyldisaccharide 4'-kinase
MLARNVLYDRGVFRSYRLPRPVISVGNLTTGGTGKTPVVRWLAEQLIARGLRPVILMRGYRAEKTGGTSDEQRMLQNYLGPRATVIAHPNRVLAAVAALKRLPQVDVFILDDGFQHRRVRRDFDLLLVNAADPFGFGHVLPRGLLREPRGGMKRADAILVTRDDPAHPAPIEATVPVLRAAHTHAGLRRAGAATTGTPGLSMDELGKRKFFAFSGIANPQGLRGQLEHCGETFAGFYAFGDHHAYTDADVAALREQAAARGAEVLVTTEKDWVKIASLPSAMIGLPILRLDLAIRFFDGDDARLLELIMERINAFKAPPPEWLAKLEAKSRAAKSAHPAATPLEAAATPAAPPPAERAS